MLNRWHHTAKILTNAQSLRNLYNARRSLHYKKSHPLNVLFFGSDEFSCGSLEALHKESIVNPSLINSIDVVVRPAKPVGRGLKAIKHSPLATLADRLGLQLHVRESLDDWQIPLHVNLVIAVSFGLFIPGKILRFAQYGGLNLHPSFLPDLRGSAPLHRAIMYGKTHIGISLQTLDEHAFDHGAILAQTARPGILIPPRCTTKQLQYLVTPIAADLLLQSLRAGVHVVPHEEIKGNVIGQEDDQLRTAFKVTKYHQQIQWRKWLPVEFDRRRRALGALWATAIDHTGKAKRLIFEDFEIVPTPDHVREHMNHLERGLTCGKDMVRRISWLHQNPTPGVQAPKAASVVPDIIPCFIDREKKVVLLPIPSADSTSCLQIRLIKEAGAESREAICTFSKLLQ